MLTHCGNNVRNRYSGCVFSVKDIVPVPLKTSRNRWIPCSVVLARGHFRSPRRDRTAYTECRRSKYKPELKPESKYGEAGIVAPGVEAGWKQQEPQHQNESDLMICTQRKGDRYDQVREDYQVNAKGNLYVSPKYKDNSRQASDS